MKPNTTVRRVYLNAGGYSDKGRRYWGVGEPLWEWCHCDDVTGLYVDGYVRAPDRKAAKLKVVLEVSRARFWR